MFILVHFDMLLYTLNIFIPNPDSKNVRGWHIKYGFVANNITKTMND